MFSAMPLTSGRTEITSHAYVAVPNTVRHTSSIATMAMIRFFKSFLFVVIILPLRICGDRRKAAYCCTKKSMDLV